VSVPCGTTSAIEGRTSLPIGVQLMAPALAESRLFAFASACEAMFPPSSPPQR
jgi:Asp-tRNA(Asn)/Glu-tRNA(Gln) amidotransferase A subunit family amidase